MYHFLTVDPAFQRPLIFISNRQVASRPAQRPPGDGERAKELNRDCNRLCHPFRARHRGCGELCLCLCLCVGAGHCFCAIFQRCPMGANQQTNKTKQTTDADRTGQARTGQGWRERNYLQVRERTSVSTCPCVCRSCSGPRSRSCFSLNWALPLVLTLACRLMCRKVPQSGWNGVLYRPRTPRGWSRRVYRPNCWRRWSCRPRRLATRGASRQSSF